MSLLPTRDLCSLKALDLSSAACLKQIAHNLDSLAVLLGASGGEIRYRAPTPARNGDFTETLQPDPLDPFERQYVTQWLTRLISELISDNEALTQRLEEMADQCSELLALCAGKMAAGASTKTHILSIGAQELRVKLQDAALVHDSLGTHTWGAAPILSQLVLPLPTSTFHILELGAGTGLVGLAVALWCRNQYRAAQIYLTDYHPQVLQNLAHNVALNDSSHAEVNVQVRTLDWQSIHQAQSSDPCAVVTAQTLTSCPVPSPTQAPWQCVLDLSLAGQFDSIIAAGRCKSFPYQSSDSWLIYFIVRRDRLHLRPIASFLDPLRCRVLFGPTHKDKVAVVACHGSIAAHTSRRGRRRIFRLSLCPLTSSATHHLGRDRLRRL